MKLEKWKINVLGIVEGKAHLHLFSFTVIV